MDTITGLGIAATQTTGQSSLTNSIRPLAIASTEDEQSRSSQASRVFLSDSGQSKNSVEQRMVEKYENAVTAVHEEQSQSDATSTAATHTPVRLEDLPPLKFFTEADVKEYEKNLMAELSRRGIDTSQPMNLKFDYEGNVVVGNDHPDKAAI